MGTKKKRKKSNGTSWTLFTYKNMAGSPCGKSYVVSSLHICPLCFSPKHISLNTWIMQANTIMWKDVFTLPGSALHAEKSFNRARVLFIMFIWIPIRFIFIFIICICLLTMLEYELFFLFFFCFNFALNVVFLCIICNMEKAVSSSVAVYSRMFLQCALHYGMPWWTPTLLCYCGVQDQDIINADLGLFDDITELSIAPILCFKTKEFSSAVCKNCSHSCDLQTRPASQGEQHFQIGFQFCFGGATSCPLVYRLLRGKVCSFFLHFKIIKKETKKKKQAKKYISLKKEKKEKNIKMNKKMILRMKTKRSISGNTDQCLAMLLVIWPIPLVC